MSILKTDWHSLLSPTTTVPPEVTFLVEDELEEGGQGTGKCPQEDWRSQSPPGWCKSSFQRDVLRPHGFIWRLLVLQKEKIKYICLGASSFVSFHSINS